MRTLLFTILIFNCLVLEAQNFDEINQIRNNKIKRGMAILGGWSLANIAVNPIFASNTSGADNAFYETNVFWNLGNIAIAGLGYYQVSKQETKGLSLAETWKQQQQIEKIILFNAGFDFAYMAAGLYVREIAFNTGNERMKGVGESIFFQGSFLLVFDTIFYLALLKTGNQLLNQAFGFSVGPQCFYVGINF